MWTNCLATTLSKPDACILPVGYMKCAKPCKVFCLKHCACVVLLIFLCILLVYKWGVSFCFGTSFIEEATLLYDLNQAYDIVYLDLQKAFDKMPHQRVIIRLKYVGINSSHSEVGVELVAWLYTQCHGRRNRIWAWSNTKWSQSQGSVLGPLPHLYKSFI